MPRSPDPTAWRRAALAAVLALAALLLAWPRLLLGGALPLDGNLLAVAYPNWSLLHDMLREPRLALWNPLRALGFPQLADPITMTLYPPSWLLAGAPDFATWLRLWVTGHTLLAAGFAAALAWRLHRRSEAAAAAALLSAFNGFFMARVTMPHHFASAAWLPAAWFCAETGSALGLGTVLAAQWLAGYPPFAILTALSAAALAWRRPRPLRFCAGAAAWAAGLSAFQLIPFLQLLAHSSRGLRLEPALAAQFSLPPLQLLKELFLPQWSSWRPTLSGDPAIVTFYVGLVGLALAAWGCWRGGPRERRLAVLSAAALVLSLGAHLPGFDRLVFLHGFRYPANWLLLPAAAAAVLAASGTARLPASWRVPAVALLAADLIAFAWTPKSAWTKPELLSSPCPLEQAARGLPLPRIYHTERLMTAWASGFLESEEDYLLMKELLAPSYGTAFSIGELTNFQTLRLAVGEGFRRRAAQDAAALDWAGADFIVDLSSGADRPRRGGVSVRRNRAALPRVFFMGERGPSFPAFDYRPGLVRVRWTTARPGRLVLSELDYPGWTLLVDGRPVAREPFAGAFLSAAVPPGRHEALFVFRPWAFLAGLAVSLAAGLLAWLRRRAARTNA